MKNLSGRMDEDMERGWMTTFLEKVKSNGLISAMIVGAIGYEVFANTECLMPISEAVGPWLPEYLPFGLFLLLYFTFCKIKISELRPRKGISSFSWCARVLRRSWCCS